MTENRKKEHEITGSCHRPVFSVDPLTVVMRGKILLRKNGLVH